MLRFIASTLKHTSRLTILGDFRYPYLRENCSSRRQISSKSHGWLNLDIIEVDEAKGIVRARYPGLNKKDYDGNEQPFPWRIMKIANILCEDLAEYDIPNIGRTFRNYGELAREGVATIITSEFSFEKNLYDFTLPKFPLLFNYRHVYTGTRSLGSVIELQNETQNKETLLNVRYRTAIIDKASGKPLSVKPIREFPSIQQPPFVFEKFQKSPNAVEYQYDLTWSDISNFGYLNFSSYTQHCLNALYYCVKFDQIKSIPELFDKGVKCIRTYNSKPVFYGDSVTIALWSSDTNEKLYYFDMEANKTSVFQCSIELY